MNNNGTDNKPNNPEYSNVANSGGAADDPRERYFDDEFQEAAQSETPKDKIPQELLDEYGVTQEDMDEVKPDFFDEKGKPVYINDLEKSFTYGGYKLSFIVNDWVNHQTIEDGERFVKYKEYCNDVKQMCNFDPKILISHMPDMGLDVVERWKICKNVCNYKTTKFSYPFYKFLEGNLYMKTKVNSADYDGEEEEEDVMKLKFDKDFKTNIPGLRVWFNRVPYFLKQPMLKAFWPCVAMYFHRDCATHLDGKLRWPVFETVCVGEYSCRKGDVIDFAKEFLDRIREEDKVNSDIERAWEEEYKSHRNAKDLPEDPKIVKRYMDDATAKKQMERMELAQGANIIEIQPEVSDAVNQKGAGSNSKETQYLKTFDRDEVANDTMTRDSWRGRCRMYLNVLLCGQWQNVKRFFKDVTNGTVSRFLWAVIPDTSKCGNMYNRPITDEEREELEKIKDFGWKLTYGEERENGTHMVVSGDINRDKEVGWLLKHIAAWQDAKMIEGIKESNDTKCKMRFRRGDYILRMGLMAVRCYEAIYGEGNLTLAMKNDIRRTLFAIADDDLEMICGLWGDKSGNKEYKMVRFHDIFSELPEEFTKLDIENLKQKYGYNTQTRLVVHYWVQNKLCKRLGQGYTNRWKKIVTK